MRSCSRSGASRFLLLAVALLLTACTARSTVSGGSAANHISREDLSRYTTVMDAVQGLRPVWLRQRTPLTLSNDPVPPGQPNPGTRETNPVWIYRDGLRVGDPTVLQNMSTAEVETIEYYDAARASRAWGQNHENGVIHLTTRGL